MWKSLSSPHWGPGIPTQDVGNILVASQKMFPLKCIWRCGRPYHRLDHLCVCVGGVVNLSQLQVGDLSPSILLLLYIDLRILTGIVQKNTLRGNDFHSNVAPTNVTCTSIILVVLVPVPLHFVDSSNTPSKKPKQKPRLKITSTQVSPGKRYLRISLKLRGFPIFTSGPP